MLRSPCGLCLFYRARRSAGKMSTAVTALLNESADHHGEELEMPEEEEHFPEENIHGQYYTLC